MRISSHYFEIKDLLIQFLAAFDDVVIKRYDRNRVPGTTQQVRYIYAPKQRVLFDIVNPGQNLILPCISVTIGSIQRDNNRVFNKNAGFFAPSSINDNTPGPSTFFYKAPVPINIEVKMSIIARYQSDMDQILSNFVPFNNPYIILSWTVPKEFNLPYTQEIRSEVLWNGNINMSYPTDVNGNQKAQIIADTGFTIKGWLFPDPVAPVKNIYKIDTFFTAVSSGTDLAYGSYTYLKANAITTDSTTMSAFANTEMVTVSGRPIMTGLTLYTPLGAP
ncbi:MAG: hypothetical protein EBX50_09795 [Chitinophagia bacterium]|nr:hypothetical protein [Chitinophagia bacterium]